MKHVIGYIVIFLLASNSVFSQSQFNTFFKPSETLNISRRNTAVIAETVLVSATLISLNQLWYSDYPRSNFKTLNDSNEWLQMDKIGHVFSSYQLTRLGANSLKWAGVSQKKQLIYGSTLGLGFLTAVEVMDGFSEEWGFSWADMVANTSGTGLYVGQQLLWQEQRIVLKYSFQRTQFAQQRPNKLGSGLAEEFLKDYNGQTYWLSANINSFLKIESIPKWLNLAFGYGAEGMLSGESYHSQFLNQSRMRQYYLSLDVDLTRIKTNSNILKSIFNVFNVIKIPFPTVEINGNGRVKWHPLYF